MKRCCPEGSLPHLTEDSTYQVQGTMLETNGISLYLTGTGEFCVMLIHDIFGLSSGHHKQVCDILTTMMPNTCVVAPNFFESGDIIENDRLLFSSCWTLPKFLCSIIDGRFMRQVRTHPWEGKVQETFDKAVEFMMDQKGVKNFGLMGLCWGSYVGFKACVLSKFKDKIICNVSCHPSVKVVAEKFNERDTEIVRHVECPQLVLSTTLDPTSWKPGGEIQKILDSKTFKVPSSFSLYKHQHGFVSRGNFSNKKIINSVTDVLEKSKLFYSTCLISLSTDV